MVTLAVLTAIYLVCELAFNARLLDVVGTGAGPDEIAAIEKYGRTLSGVAVALVVLQIMLAIRARSGRGSPSNFAILIVCALAGSLTYEGLHRLVDGVVKESSPELRRTSLTLVLLQQAMLEGRAEIAGLGEGRELLSTPAGKAFLALFPAMALAVDNVDQKLQEGKLQLLRDRLSVAAGGPQAFFQKYRTGVIEVNATFTGPYRRASEIPVDVDQRVDEEHKKAWSQYVDSLSKRRWTPASVPVYAHDRVRKEVSSRGVAVPRGWQPWDEPGFREAVSRRVRSDVSAARARLKGIPPGLSWPAYFAHPSVQEEVRRRAGLPNNVRLKHDYASHDEFTREVFHPMIEQAAARSLGGRNLPNPGA